MQVLPHSQRFDFGDVGALWSTLADCCAATLQTHRPPVVLRALRFTPPGRHAALRSRITAGLPFDPATDIFRTVVEERQRLKAEASPLATVQADFLKVLANAGSYGIYVELNRGETTTAPASVRLARSKPGSPP